MKKFGLVGNPIKHSFSANYFNNKFSNECIDSRYDLYELDDISYIIDLINKDVDLIGLNVTSPFKKSAVQYVDELTDVALNIGGVNTLFIKRNISGKNGDFSIIGHNTDVEGFEKQILNILCKYSSDLLDISSEVELSDKFKKQSELALVFGTGAAANSVSTALAKFGIKCMKVSRGLNGDIKYSQIDKSIISAARYLINATPLGMGTNNEKCVDIPYQYISNQHCCIDLIYNPSETKFLNRCKSQGAYIENGYAMLLAQAEASWRFWSVCSCNKMP